MKRPIFLTPVFKERIWGGANLRDQFGYEISSELTGECWAISGHENGPSVVRDGEYKGRTLRELWEKERNLFNGYEGEKFPLLTKILDANKDLSVQVHPHDYFAKEHEAGELGKTECWYIIDCIEDAEIVYGHHARTKEELVKMVELGQWDQLLRKVKIKPGDFFYVPSGTIHAIGQGTLVLETQQNSDSTYRVYDYDRRDSKGDLRELHLEKALAVSTVPHFEPTIENAITYEENLQIVTFVKDTYFTVYKWMIEGEAKLAQSQAFLLVSIIHGEGSIEKDGQENHIKKGDHLLLPSDFGQFVMKGKLECIVSHP